MAIGRFNLLNQKQKPEKHNRTLQIIYQRLYLRALEEERSREQANPKKGDIKVKNIPSVEKQERAEP